MTSLGTRLCRLQNRLRDYLCGINVTIATPREAILVAAAQARSGFGDAFLEALVSHGGEELLGVGSGEFLLHLAD